MAAIPDCPSYRRHLARHRVRSTTCALRVVTPATRSGPDPTTESIVAVFLECRVAGVHEIIRPVVRICRHRVSATERAHRRVGRNVAASVIARTRRETARVNDTCHECRPARIAGAKERCQVSRTIRPDLTNDATPRYRIPLVFHLTSLLFIHTVGSHRTCDNYPDTGVSISANYPNFVFLHSFLPDFLPQFFKDDVLDDRRMYGEWIVWIFSTDRAVRFQIDSNAALWRELY